MLTDAKVRNAKPRPKTYKLADTNRLCLMATPSGGKLWRWNYEYDGKNKTMAFVPIPASRWRTPVQNAMKPGPCCAKDRIPMSRSA
jgi:hypothetical protein